MIIASLATARVTPTFVFCYAHENNFHWSLLPIRIPPGLFATFKVPVDVFGFAELVETFFTQFSTHAAHFEATERSGIVIGQWVVDPERSGLDFLEEAFRLEWIVRIEVGSQAVFAIVLLSFTRAMASSKVW